MKLSHAKHVVHQHGVLAAQINEINAEIEKAKQKVKDAEADVAKIGDQIKDEMLSIEGVADQIGRLESAKAAYQTKVDNLVAFQKLGEKPVKDAQKVVSDLEKSALGVVKKMQVFANEFDAAKARIAEIESADQERKATIDRIAKRLTETAPSLAASSVDAATRLLKMHKTEAAVLAAMDAAEKAAKERPTEPEYRLGVR